MELFRQLIYEQFALYEPFRRSREHRIKTVFRLIVPLHTPEVIYTLAGFVLIGGKGSDFIGWQVY